MGLFGLFGKRKESACGCCSSTPIVELDSNKSNVSESVVIQKCCEESECTIKSIKVLGPGCKSCHDLNQASKAAVVELGMNLEVEYITDMETIVSYGVMSVPALVVNEKVVSMGRTLKPADIIKLFKKLGYC